MSTIRCLYKSASTLILIFLYYDFKAENMYCCCISKMLLFRKLWGKNKRYKKCFHTFFKLWYHNFCSSIHFLYFFNIIGCLRNLWLQLNLALATVCEFRKLSGTLYYKLKKEILKSKNQTKTKLVILVMLHLLTNLCGCFLRSTGKVLEIAFPWVPGLK